MIFASPIWLLGLLPWAVVVVYLLPGRGRAVVVPFVGLWRGPVGAARRARRRRWPGAAMVLMLIALLLMLLAAGQPGIAGYGTADSEISIVLDRGATMSLPSASGKPLRGVVGRVGLRLSDQTTVHLIPVPGLPIDVKGDRWRAMAEQLAGTALPTSIDQTVANQLRTTRGPVLVLSDQPIAATSPRVWRIEPEPVADSVAITRLGARDLPRPAVLLRLENHSDAKSATVLVQSGGQLVEKKFALPTRGNGVDEMVELRSLGPAVAATIEPAGGQSPWSAAYLVRESDGVRINVGPQMDDAVGRLAGVYARNRHAAPDAEPVLISNHPLPNGESGIWIDTSNTVLATGVGTVVVPHPLTRSVRHWPPAHAAVLPVGFTALVSVDGQAIVAVREGPHRQVWLNSEMGAWEKTSDFVVFFANALDWIGGRQQAYTSLPPAMLGDDWKRISDGYFPVGDGPGEWPGIYHSESGRSVAINAGRFPDIVPARDSTETAEREFGKTVVPLPGILIDLALACMVVAASLWLAGE